MGSLWWIQAQSRHNMILIVKGLLFEGILKGNKSESRNTRYEAITVIQMRDDNGLDQMAALALDCIVYTGQEGVGRVRLKEWEGTGPSFVMKANNVHARCKTNERTVISGCNLRLKILNAKSLRLMPQINCGCEWLKARPRKEGKQGKIILTQFLLNDF